MNGIWHSSDPESHSYLVDHCPYVDYSKTMNVDINSPEFKEYVEMKNMSETQIDQKLKDIEDEAERIIAAQEKEVTVDGNSEE